MGAGTASDFPPCQEVEEEGGNERNTVATGRPALEQQDVPGSSSGACRMNGTQKILDAAASSAILLKWREEENQLDISPATGSLPARWCPLNQGQKAFDGSDTRL